MWGAFFGRPLRPHWELFLQDVHRDLFFFSPENLTPVKSRSDTLLAGVFDSET